MKVLRTTRVVGVTSLIGFICLSWAGLARADVVFDWNAITVQTSLPVRPGPSTMLDLAMVHTAMHDAIQAYQGRFEPYTASIRAVTQGYEENTDATARMSVTIMTKRHHTAEEFLALWRARLAHPSHMRIMAMPRN